MPTLRFEQAVYGSFPWWGRGYDMLAASPGCRPEWLAEFRAACQNYGEPPPGFEAPDALFVLRLPSGVWAVVGVGSPGRDDRGRPGALAFHGLFLAEREFARARRDLNQLQQALRRDWGPETVLGPGAYPFESRRYRIDTESEEARTAARVLDALAAGRRVVIESAEPIRGVVGSVWRGLRRRRASVATLAYSVANRFDLVALPRLAGVELDPSYVTLDELNAPPRPPLVTRGKLALAGLAAAATAATGFLLLRGCDGSRVGETGPVPPTAARAPADSNEPAPSPPRGSAPIDPDERDRIVEGLLDLAARFGVEADPAAEPAALMAAISGRLRYRGRWLTDDELAELRRDPSPEAARALAWHAHLRHFAADRPLPPDFAAGPLPWQLAALSWSFRVEPHPNLTLAEVPFALADALAMGSPVRPSPLAASHPALAEYARFLARLPRR